MASNSCLNTVSIPKWDEFRVGERVLAVLLIKGIFIEMPIGKSVQSTSDGAVAF